MESTSFDSYLHPELKTAIFTETMFMKLALFGEPLFMQRTPIQNFADTRHHYVIHSFSPRKEALNCVYQ